MARGDAIHRTTARNARMKDADIGNAQAHNERQKESYVNQDIVTERTPMNVHFKSPSSDYTAMFDDIVTEQRGLLQENTNYLFVKRFTAKEEHRRLQCGVYLARKHPEYTEISTQNKINFISGLRELSECVVYGLYVLFNSTLYDSYYRILNGSTQVNSTEINSMPVPPL